MTQGQTARGGMEGFEFIWGRGTIRYY